ncbi:hypothetical protein OMF40_20565, partial [Bordetella pertussis]
AAQGLQAAPVILLSPAGRRYDQAEATTLAAGTGAIFICGRYEGVDQRFIERCVTHELSLGDFVLSGGELAALAMMDAAVRLLPGVLNDGDSALQDSFNAALDGLLATTVLARPEKTYSEPLAVRQFTKETLLIDGKPQRDFPLLRSGGAHLQDPDAQRWPDLRQRFWTGLGLG